MSLVPIRRAAAGLSVIAAVILSGCTSTSDTTGTSAGDELGGTLTIFAAASLTGAFDELAARFEAQYPDLNILPVSYDGSSVLATQLIAGAPADVFASADETNMAKVTDTALASGSEPFATNTLQIAVAPGNPLAIQNLVALTDPELTVIMCAPEVPCGHASQTLLGAAGVTLTPASEEQNVTAVLAKVKSGEVDAGLVYQTDVAAAGDAVTGIEVDGAEKATNVYPLVALHDAPNPDAASTFVTFVLSDEGQKVLADFGFGAP